MIPQQQLYFNGIEEDGVPGDCHRACIASILELPVGAVPHFLLEELEAKGSKIHFWEQVDAFLLSHGLLRVALLFAYDTVEGMLNAADAWHGTPCHYILDGESSTGSAHSVVCKKNRIVHNPSPRASLIGPMAHNQRFRVNFLVPAGLG